MATKYPPDTFLIVVYERDWLVGKVIDKKTSGVEDWGPQYLHVDFKVMTGNNLLKWPLRQDVFNCFEVGHLG